MNKLHFKTEINAPKEKVWEALWSDEGYRNWTSVFTEGSYAESDWKEGSRIRFLSADGSGMFGVIKKKVDYRQMQFEHLGEIKAGKEEPKDWAPAMEDYYLTENNGTTELRVELDMNEEFQEYFKATFPKALSKVKELSEN